VQVTHKENEVHLHTFYYAMDLAPEGFSLVNPRLDDVLIQCPWPIIYWPEFDGVTMNWRFDRLEVKEATAGAVEIRIRCKSESDIVSPMTITLTCFEQYVELSAECSAQQDCLLAHWNFFRPGSKVNAFWAHHFRNRHGNAQTYETYNLAQGTDAIQPVRRDFLHTPKEMIRQWTEDADFTTFSTDWQFAPHPSFVLFQKDEAMLCLGARDIPQSFGLEVRIGRNILKHWRLNYGGEYGHPLRAGEKVPVCRMYLWLDHNGDVFSSVDHYVNLLLEDQQIPRRSLREVPHWWRKPLYCTWLDQGFVANHTYSHLHKTDGWTGKKKDTKVDRYRALTPEMIARVLETIDRERLPFGWIVLDASWYVAQGQWQADPARFPNMRQTIEQIHNAGLRVCLWMAPFAVENEAEVARRPEYLVNEGRVLDRYPFPGIDFSNPKVQEEYVKPTIRYMVAGEPDCLNADAIKLDYCAYKVFPEYRIHDLTWRGEEMFIHKTLKLIYDEMKKHKPDACMIGSMAHPHFVDCIDMVRTYDVSGTQYQHAERGKMIKHFCPGILLSFDLVEERYNWDRYFRLAEQNNALVEVGNILGIEGRPLTAADYEFLRSRLAMWS